MINNLEEKFNLSQLYLNNLETVDDSINILKNLFKNKYNDYDIGLWILENITDTTYISEKDWESGNFYKKIFKSLLKRYDNNIEKLNNIKKIGYHQLVWRPAHFNLNMNDLDKYQKDYKLLLGNKDFLQKNKVDFFMFNAFSDAHNLKMCKYLIPEEFVNEFRKTPLNLYNNKHKKIAFLFSPKERTPSFNSFTNILKYLSRIDNNIILYIDNVEEELSIYQKNCIKSLKVNYIRDLDDDTLFNSMLHENIDIVVSMYGHYKRYNILLRKPCKITVSGYEGGMVFPKYFIDYNMLYKNNILKNDDDYNFIYLDDIFPVLKKTDFKLSHKRPIFDSKKIKIGLITTDLKLSKDLIDFIIKLLKNKNILLTIYSFVKKEYFQKIIGISNDDRLFITTYNNDNNYDLKKNLFYIDTFIYNNHSTAKEILGSYRPMISFFNKEYLCGMYSKTLIDQLNMNKELCRDKVNNYYDLVMKYVNSEKEYYKMYDKFIKNLEKSGLIDNKKYSKNFYKILDDIKIDKNKYDAVNNNLDKDINRIPNIIHFVYGFKEQTEEFDLYKYIAIKSAYDVNKPDKIYLYYHYESFGKWWEKLKSFVILQKVNLPKNIYGNKLYHYAHMADIIRLQKLIEHGGIYLDIDTICLRSFSDLLNNDFIMGIQNNSDNTSIYGLCNAVILSKPNSKFAIKWLESYKNFRSKGRDEFWDEHSVLKPLELSKEYPNDIKILNFESFFYPLWYNINSILFNETFNVNEYKKIVKNNYCIHLWETFTNKYLKTLDENTILTKNTLYNILARKFLRNNISLVFLTYNRFELTKKCLDSYLKSLNLEFIKELIILDNNSEDNVKNYLKEYKKKNKKIKIIFSKENLGVCGGRIILFKKAKGDIIISIDSDAYLIDESIFTRISDMLYDEKYGIIGISGAYMKSWEFRTHIDIDNNDENEYKVDLIAGCFQAFRKDLYYFSFSLDKNYGKFWVEDADLSLQSLNLNKINFRINQKKYIDHIWGGSGRDYKDLFESNWNYFVNKWKGKIFFSFDNDNNKIDNFDTFNTKYGLVTLYKNDFYIYSEFKKGKYWDEDTLIKLKKYIDPNRNILEIGGHCGTSSIVYSSFLNKNKKVFVFEPQKNMFNLLEKNINQNNLESKIIPYNFGVFCYNGIAKMNDIDLDGGGGIVNKRYNEENNLDCNFGGIGLGKNGEEIKIITINDINISDIGFIHCDAQGSENFIFSKAINTIKKYRPVILFENNQLYAKILYENVCKSYPEYKKESIFDIKKYCMNNLNYSLCIDKFNGSIDTLLIP